MLTISLPLYVIVLLVLFSMISGKAYQASGIQYGQGGGTREWGPFVLFAVFLNMLSIILIVMHVK